MRDPKLAHILVCLVASDSARRKDHFQKKLYKTDLPLKFVKLVSKILYLFLAENNDRLLLFVCCLLFVATLSDFGLLFFKTLF